MKQHLLICIIIFALTIPFKTAAETFYDDFDSLDSQKWNCEYSCPEITNGIAIFSLEPGEINTESTWNKLSYRNQFFQYGTYTMTFRYNRRPLEAEVWAGWALYHETSGVQEINFGIETACKSRCDDETIILESYKNSVNQEVIIPTGSNLFDGTWHSIKLDYSITKISLYFDELEIASINDPSVIPTESMKLIPGARVISGTLDSTFQLEVEKMSFSEPNDTATTYLNNKHLQNQEFLNYQYITVDGRITAYPATQNQPSFNVLYNLPQVLP